MSNSSLPNRRLRVPSDHRITRLFDCLRCTYNQALVKPRPRGTYILAQFILCPSPANGVFYLEFDGHTFFTDVFGLLRVIILVFRTHVGVWMKWLGVNFDEIRQPHDPILVKEMVEAKSDRLPRIQEHLCSRHRLNF